MRYIHIERLRISQSIESLENAIVENSDGSLVIFLPLMI